jgi:hypothetical protein
MIVVILYIYTNCGKQFKCLNDSGDQAQFNMAFLVTCISHNELIFIRLVARITILFCDISVSKVRIILSN